MKTRPTRSQGLRMWRFAHNVTNLTTMKGSVSKNRRICSGQPLPHVTQNKETLLLLDQKLRANSKLLTQPSHSQLHSLCNKSGNPSRVPQQSCLIHGLCQHSSEQCWSTKKLRYKKQQKGTQSGLKPSGEDSRQFTRKPD